MAEYIIYLAIGGIAFIVGAVLFVRYFSDWQPVKSLEIKIPFRRPRFCIQDEKLGGTFEIDRGNRGSGDKHNYHLKELGMWQGYCDWQLCHLDDPFQVVCGKGSPTIIAKHAKSDEMGNLRQEIKILQGDRDHYKSMYEMLKADIQNQTEIVLEQVRKGMEAAKRSAREDART